MFVLENMRWRNVNEAVNYCNFTLFNMDKELMNFLDKISEHKGFDMSDAGTDYIADRIMKFRQADLKMKVVIYESLNPFSRAYGYYTKSRPYDVNINSRKLGGRSTESIVNTLVHELIHAIDGLDVKHSYGHGSNSREGKQNTAPYWIGNLAAKIYSKSESVEEYPRVIRSPWYKRLWRFIF